MMKLASYFVVGIVLGATLLTAVLRMGVDDSARSPRLTYVDTAAEHAGSEEASGFSEPQSGITGALREASTIEAELRSLLRDGTLVGGSEVEVLLLRLARLDFSLAVSVATHPSIDRRLLALLLVQLAASDRSSALHELSNIDDVFRSRYAALELAAAYAAEDPEIIDDIARCLPEESRLSFKVEALRRLATASPASALRGIDRLDHMGARRHAIKGIAAEWARNDPDGMFAALDSLPDRSLARVFLASALTSLAMQDAKEAIGRLAAIEPHWLIGSHEGFEALQILAELDPTGLLYAVEDLPVTARTVARNLALSAMAEQDPVGAIAAASEASFEEREMVLTVAAKSYARLDPHKALEWAKSLEPANARVMGNVIAGIAEDDFDWALQIVEDSSEDVALFFYATVVLDGALEKVPQVADRLMAKGDSHASELQALLGNWVRADMQAALDWVSGSPLSANEAVMGELARHIANEDAVAAASAVERLPKSSRSSWVGAIVFRYANVDPVSANRVVVTLPAGAGRDEALGRLMAAHASAGRVIDPALLSAFSSESARDEALEELLLYIHAGNVELARRLSTDITDSDLRARYQRVVALLQP